MFSRQTVLEKHTACHLTIFHAQGESHMSLIIPTKPQNQVPKITESTHQPVEGEFGNCRILSCLTGNVETCMGAHA
jgi:hypothetical protein